MVKFLNYRDLLKDSKEIVIYGTSNAAEVIYEKLCNMGYKDKIKFFVDTYKKGKFKGYQVKKPKSLEGFNGLVIIASLWASDIYRNLKDKNIFVDLIDLTGWYVDENAYELTEEDSYLDSRRVFRDYKSLHLYDRLKIYREYPHPSLIIKSDFKAYFHPKVKPEKGDIIIDAGAWIGDTVGEFNESVKGIKQIYAFEPFEENIKTLQEISSKYNNVTVVDKGLWAEKDTLAIAETRDSTGSASVSGFGAPIKVVDLDTFCDYNGIAPTLIKMDIEGSEIMGLIGAEDTIKKYRPKLMICIYHTNEHFETIPKLIKQMVPEYKFYLGHHTGSLSDTVLYATMD